jgi:hypothetical protein
MVEHTESKVQQGERYVVIGREPFARMSRTRRVVHEGNSCSWCGQVRKNGSLFEYGVLHDASSRPNWLHGQFCSLSCMKTYHIEQYSW